MTVIRTSMLVVVVVVVLCGRASGQDGTTNGEWRSYAGDVWGTKYAALEQITGENFSDLEVAWRWQTADALLPYPTVDGVTRLEASTVFDRLEQDNPGLWVTRPGIGRLSATPLMVDGVLFLSTPLYQAAAIDARSGETLWVYNPVSYTHLTLPTKA